MSWDNVKAANNQSYLMTDANRLNATTGPWGTSSLAYDGVGNRTQEISTPPGGSATTRSYAYSPTANLLANVMAGTTTERTFVHDAAGNITLDTRSGIAFGYTYNLRNRLVQVRVGGSLKGTYRYNGLEQLVYRSLTTCLSRRRPGTPSGITHFIHDRVVPKARVKNGNVIASCRRRASKVTDGTGPAGTVREYIWLPETEIAPTAGSRTVLAEPSKQQVDRPIAVVDAVSTAPVIWQVHVDHLNRPIKMTDVAKASVWDAVWSPWGSPYATSGTATLDARFPGQWYQLESGLHYNWHRHYDPTLGRYTQPDPLGFVDGPSVYGYAGDTPIIYVDPDGRFWGLIITIGGSLLLELAADQLEKYCQCGGGSSHGNWIFATGSGIAIGDHWVDPLKKKKKLGGSSPVRSRVSMILVFRV